MQQRCGTCRCFFRLSPTEGVCRARPPVPIMVGVRTSPIAVNGAGQEPVITSYFPPMNDKGWCSLWSAAEQIETKEIAK